MEILVWIGTAIALVGLGALVWCILKVSRARRQGLDEEALRGVVASVMPVNLGALFLSVIGLMLVVVGILLG